MFLLDSIKLVNFLKNCNYNSNSNKYSLIEISFFAFSIFLEFFLLFPKFCVSFPKMEPSACSKSSISRVVPDEKITGASN